MYIYSSKIKEVFCVRHHKQASSRAPATSMSVGSPLTSRGVIWSLAPGHMEAGPWIWRWWRQTSLATSPMESGILLVKGWPFCHYSGFCFSSHCCFDRLLFFCLFVHLFFLAWQRCQVEGTSVFTNAAMSPTLTSPSRWWWEDGRCTMASTCSSHASWSPPSLCSSSSCRPTLGKRSRWVWGTAAHTRTDIQAK